MWLQITCFFWKTSSNSLEKLLGFIAFQCFTLVESIFMWVQSNVFEKINVFLVNTVLGPVSVIANNMFFLKN